MYYELQVLGEANEFTTRGASKLIPVEGTEEKIEAFVKDAFAFVEGLPEVTSSLSPAG